MKKIMLVMILLASCSQQANLQTATEPNVIAPSESAGETNAPSNRQVEGQEASMADLGWIAFITSNEDRQDVWLIRPDGSGEVNLTRNLPNLSADAPAWSPDGSLIAFDGILNSDSLDDIFLLTVNANPTQRQLTTQAGPDCYASFSPDGQRIVYRSERDNNSDLYVVDIDGTEIARLTDDPLADFEPAWSPDGTQIAFTSGRTGNSEIFVMNADGSNLRQLTDLVGLDWRPAWSPDGNWIVFESWRNGNGDLFLMAADGSELQQLTDDPSEDGHPTFSPDGRYVAFHSQRTGEYELFILELANPENQWQLPTTGPAALLPSWSPVFVLPNELPE